MPVSMVSQLAASTSVSPSFLEMRTRDLKKCRYANFSLSPALSLRKFRLNDSRCSSRPQNSAVTASLSPSFHTFCTPAFSQRKQSDFSFKSNNSNSVSSSAFYLLASTSRGNQAARQLCRGMAADSVPSEPEKEKAAVGELGGPGPDELVFGISETAEVSVYVVRGTELVREAQRRHSTAPTATAALGRLLLGTSLLAALKGSEETVQVMFSGRGSLGQMAAVSSDGGRLVKGFVSNPACDPPLNSQGKMDVGTAVGAGILTVVRTHPSWSNPYTGTVPLKSGEVAEDLAAYLADSEQVNSAVGLGVSIGRQAQVVAAGGFLVQVLPICSEETLAQLERNVSSLPPMSELAASTSGRGIAERLLAGLGPRFEEEAVVPHFGLCDVEDLRPRMLRAVESLGAADVKSLLEEQGHVEVRCEFCAEVVRFQEGDLSSVLAPALS
eukprot:TRINITY_DN26363_c0_g1_i1.p1 TRINITY_DN26363_c0_g1~~TRINITY_DN26363_c0_g1_i1.p1  ORF type:complete len:441 (-),score=68.43 TRINITY_DN26363_c0_g1_i1:508-1830(-)